MFAENEAQALLNGGIMEVWSMYGKGGTMPTGSSKGAKEKQMSWSFIIFITEGAGHSDWYTPVA